MKPNPGSKEALDQGCTCPVLDNRYGQGFTHKGDRLFIMNGDCPLHGFIKEVMPVPIANV